MSSVNKNMLVALLLVTGLLVLTGCGSEKNDKAVFDGDQHPAGWLPAGHMAAAKADETVCAGCHGDDYAGGVSGVSCTLCHLGGVNSVHPVSWGTGSQVIPNHGTYAQQNGTGRCSNANCHGTNLEGVTSSGPACASCHQSGSFSAGCASCHTTPPSGTVAPNRAGAHNTATGHFAAQVTLPDGCNTCHNGAGSGTVLHDNGVVDVQFLSAYNAKSGIAVYNADGTCSNVSCHGGQTTPVWLSGSINVATQCTSCHSFGTTEYNSFVSGQHYEHVIVQNINCNFCHDFTKLMQNHFTSLNTSTLEGPASATIEDYVNFNPGPPYPTCTPSCHETRVW